MKPMTQLLVSVRSLAEAKTLPLNKIGIVDIKEPLRGSLGSADLDTICEIYSAIGNSTIVSVALGELSDGVSFELDQLPPVAFAKFGLSQLAGVDWQPLWEQRIRRLPTGTLPVAVIYADWKTCGAPAPEEIIAAATRLQCGGFLLDTYEKTNGNLFSHFSPDEIQLISQSAKAMNAKFVIAGGISSPQNLDQALALSPDWIGVRGAICDGERTGSICSQQINDFLTQFTTAIEDASVTNFGNHA